MTILDPDLLLRAYAIGVFPMSDSRDAREVYWVEPRRRAIGHLLHPAPYRLYNNADTRSFPLMACW